VFNSVHVIDNGQVVAKYRKLHLFSLLGEDKAFKEGDSWCLAETSIGKVGVIICYDLRFPELSRRLALEGARVICVPASGPSPVRNTGGRFYGPERLRTSCMLLPAMPAV
jgi:predicted amidohydrolase